jgi:hypothetical protein
LLISSISAKNFQAVEVQNISDAESVLFSPYSENFTSNFTPESEPIPAGLPNITIDADLGRFTLVSKTVVDELQAKVEAAFAHVRRTAETEALQGYFQQELSKYYALLPMGYSFTAANDAFLTSIDAEYVKIGGSQIDLDGSIQDVNGCIANLSSPAKTGANFHWAVGADLRRTWAEKKLNETIANRDSQGGYTTLRDLLFSYSWCGISNELASQAKDVGGTPVDESALAPLASEKLAEAEDSFSSTQQQDYDAAWHLENAYQANSSGLYGAAIYEAVYAKTMQDATANPPDDVQGAADALAGSGRSSLWGKIYYGQGMYLYTQAKDGNYTPADAYRILKFSSALDKASSDIDKVLLNAKSESPSVAQAMPEGGKGPTGPDSALSVALALCVAAFGLAMVYRAASGQNAPKAKQRK